MNHVHVSALSAFAIFLQVLIMGFLWRLASAHLAKSNVPALSALGKAGAQLY
jgi:hypothetical protein